MIFDSSCLSFLTSEKPIFIQFQKRFRIFLNLNKKNVALKKNNSNFAARIKKI